MRNPTRRALLALAALSLPGAARAEAPVQAPAPAPQGDAPAPAGRPSQAEVQASLNAIGAADTRRLLTDRVYAGELLGHLDRIAPYMSDDPAAGNAVLSMRLLALATLERPAEGGPLIDRVIEARPGEAGQYAAAWLAALGFRDRARAVALIETASRAVPGVGWADLRSLLDRQTVFSLLFQLKTGNQNAERLRFAEALFRIGWPGGGDAESGDFIRAILLDDRIAAGDAGAARGYAGGMTTLPQILSLSTGRRYDPALPDGADRMAMIRAALERQDRVTREGLAAAPQDMERLVDRIAYFRRLGREEEALAVALPHLRDAPATAVNGEHGMWVVSEAAFALAALGRLEEALALMDRIAALPLADHPGLISLRINHLELLWDAGRHEEVLRRAALLDTDIDRFASDYGKMWIASSRVCALAALGRPAETAPLIARMVELRDTNAPALTRAYLCLGDDAAAAALLVHRLEGSDPGTAIMALQDYTLGGGPAEARAASGALRSRLLALRERPEVRAAFDRVARTLSLPLSRSYWGDF